jgi:putative tryptophan/tyrosine transport system substrate-binding protein
VPTPRRERLEAAVRTLTVRVEVIEAQTAQDLEKAFAGPAVQRADALLLPEYSVLIRREIGLFALKRRLPTVGGDRFFVHGGGFMSYGPDPTFVYERAAAYTGKLLRGVKAQDMPVEEPTRYELVISMVTARALGLTIPPSLLARADQVIE